ncbi:TIGR02922 family protein [Colwellia sp. C1TZA3]|uniref:TIGR02922 family protein n=1 Tax=Colwellia sp. C1TZA3 TaxID=2508879 RepID=UPI0011B95462|nr:TIGR02922 family protein [Colwellia sp. C1TZA3]TWX68154.1 TIGR02922 family protein [Colwellia sp. C1TZA3]
MDEHNDVDHRLITIIFYSDTTLKLMHEVHSFPESKTGRVVIPESFKVDKSIIAVCDGAVAIIDKFGDRM